MDEALAVAAPRRSAASPDDHGAGLSRTPLDALRYDGQSDDPDEVAGALRSMMPSAVRVLDVGCGTGSVTLIANAGRGNEVIAVEPDAARAAAAASRGLQVHCGFLDADFVARHGPFDVVMLSDVLEHLPAPAAMLELVMTALKPGGTVLASVPNVAHWSVRLSLLFGRFDYRRFGIMDATHLRWFTERTIRTLFEERGLCIVAVRQTAGFDLEAYHEGLWRLVPHRLKAPLIRRLTRLLPRLFGCQHVLKAVKAAPLSE